MKNKMTTKAPIEGGIDLDTFITRADPIVAPVDLQKLTPNLPNAAKQPVTPKSAKKRTKGRPTVSDEPRNERLQIRLTTKELERLKGKAGIASVSAFVRQMMEEKGII